MKARVYHVSLALLFSLLLTALAINYVNAERDRLTISISFTGVTVEQGESISASLKIRNNLTDPANVELTIDKPSGWEVETRYRGYKVFRFFIEPNDEITVSVRINVPADATPGINKITFTARDINTGVVSNEITLEVEVLEKPKKDPIELTVSFPSLTGEPGTTLEYRFDLKNNLDRDIVVGLEARNVPEGWVVSFKPSAFEDRIISSISLEPERSRTGMVMEVRPPRTVSPGSYKITLVATANGFSKEAEVTAVITGISRFRLTTPNQLLSFEVGAGEEKKVTIVFINEGSEHIRDISCSVSPPSRWDASVEPDKIDLVRPGETASVTLTVKPPANTLAGDYSLRVSAFTRAAGSESLQFRVTVTKQTFWGIIGVGVVAASVMALLVVFWRFGRP